jgi:amino acid transporter
LFRLGDVITAILMMRILIQFVSQSVGLIVWHYRKPQDERPFKMPLFPIPAILSILIWMFIFFSNDPVFIKGALVIIGSGLVVYFVRDKLNTSQNI